MTTAQPITSTPTTDEQPDAAAGARATVERIALARDSRGMLFGMTGTGKSTVAEQLMLHWRDTMPRPRILIVDSKPRFRGEWELSGISTQASRRYKGWGHGAFVPGSVVLPLQNPAEELKAAWARKHSVAIAQVDSLAHLPALDAAAAAFYRTSNARYRYLALFDEMADFFGSSATFARGNAILQIARSGRERGVAMLGCSQRPRHIPSAVITECSQLYLFELAYAKDWEHLREMGLPETARIPAEQHQFLYYNRRDRRGGYFRLALERHEPEHVAKGGRR